MSKTDDRIADWKRKLVDLTRRNALLFFTPSRGSSLRVAEPTMSEVFRRTVIEEEKWRFLLPPEEDHAEPQQELIPTGPNHPPEDVPTEKPLERKPNELLCKAREGRELRVALRNLHRRSRSDFEERGVCILHIVFGILEWQEAAQSERIRSPILLVPSHIERDSVNDPFQIRAAEEDVVLNPALEVKLWNDFRIQLPALPDAFEEGLLEDYLENVQAQVRERGWKVHRECWIGLFSFHKLLIYQDLNNHSELIKRHPMILALSGEGSVSTGESLPDPRELDERVDPTESFLVADADSSQLACIEAVKQGTDIVLQGPPGTGKSQTITNLVAESIAAGRTVLFMSEKMAALEVVYDRLRKAHLGHYCLELHSHKANKREVVSALYDCYRDSVKPQRCMTKEEFEKLTARRAQLNDYIDSLHQVRSPLERSAFSVLGELAQLERVKFVSAGDCDAERLTSARLDVAVQLARKLERVWKIVAEGDRFPWFGCRVASYSAETRAAVLELIGACENALNRLAEETEKSASTLGYPTPACVAEADWLLKTVELLGEGPGIEADWLLNPAFASQVSEASSYRELCLRYRAIRQSLCQHYTNGLFGLPLSVEERLVNALKAYASCVGRAMETAQFPFTERDRVLAWAREFASRSDAWIAAAERVCELLGFSCELTMEAIPWLVRIAELCCGADRPDRKWFAPACLQAVRESMPSFRRDCEKRAGLRAQILEHYEPAFFSVPTIQKFEGAVNTVSSALELPLATLVGPHRNAIRSWVQDSRSRLRQWQKDAEIICGTLGLPQDIRVADLHRVIRVCDLCGASERPDKAWFDRMALDGVRQTIRDAGSNHETRAAARSQLLSEYDDSLLSLDIEQLADEFLNLYNSPLRWFKSGFYRLRRKIRRCRRDAKVPRNLSKDILAARELVRLERKIQEASSATKTQLGAWYRGYETDFGRAEKALGVAEELISLAGVSLPGALVEQACYGSVPSPELLSAAARLKDSVTIWEEKTGTLSKLVEGNLLSSARTLLREGRLGEVSSLLDELTEPLDVAVSTCDAAEASLRTGMRRTPEETLEDLRRVRDIVRLEAKIAGSSERLQGVFGVWYRGFETNFVGLEKAMEVVARLREIVGETLPAKLIDQTCAGASPDELKTVASGLKMTLTTWEQSTGNVEKLIRVEQIPSTHLPVRRSRLEDISAWAKALSSCLETIVTETKLVEANLQPKAQRTLREILEDLRQCAVLRESEAKIAGEADRLSRTYGNRFSGVDTNWDELLAAMNWADRLRSHLAKRPRSDALLEITRQGRASAPPVEPLGSRIAGFRSALQKVQEKFREDDERSKPGCLMTAEEERGKEPGPLYHGVTSFAEMDFISLRQRLCMMRSRVDEISDWIDYKHIAADFRDAKLWHLHCELLQHPLIEAFDLPKVVRRSLLQAWTDWLFTTNQALARFHSRDHESIIAEFRELDRRHAHLGFHRVIAEASRRNPQDKVMLPGGEAALLHREALKKKRHLPIRKLFAGMPNLLTRLKPCLLMSPLSVSQFLDPSLIKFDLVIFDEASQICSEDAVGAIYRGKQLVVCGDNKQLPPTAFFEQGISDEFENPNAGEEFDVFSSILDELCAIGIPQSWLRWHYRSRHESLIAFSNLRFYDKRLVTFPAAKDKHPTLGVEFAHVPDGVYDRGGRRDNAREAEVVVELVTKHILEHPNRSLGVVAFSVAQMNAIEDRIEQLLRERRELERRFEPYRQLGEPFFIKNLENVQGDERDVIIFSVGYGRDQQQRLTMHFGPLNIAGGERRLNVAITRAREKVIVVSSIRHADFDLTATTAPGVLALHKYLKYAELGPQSLDAEVSVSLGDFESPLEEDVAGAIRSLGYDVVPQVGCSGFRVDLGVVDPAEPGQFLLGVECDGATYHSAYTARDRDRLRQEVLEKLGWRIHRVWSPDWVRRRETEMRRLRETLKQAHIAPKESSIAPTTIPASSSKVAPVVIRTEPAAFENKDCFESWTVPYRVCRPKTQPPKYIEFCEPCAKPTLVAMLREVVDAEGPVHIEIAAVRLADRWGFRRVGKRMMNAVRTAVATLSATMATLSVQGEVSQRGDFLWPRKKDFTLRVRRPDPDDKMTDRGVDFIPPEEMELAIQQLVESAISLSEDNLMTQTARLFGFDRNGANISKRIGKAINHMIETGALVCKGDRVCLAQSANGPESSSRPIEEQS